MMKNRRADGRPQWGISPFLWRSDGPAVPHHDIEQEETVFEETQPRWRKRTARFVGIAELAGVSTTTVDRVLNERGSVSTKARRRAAPANEPVEFRVFYSANVRQSSYLRP
jgi:hypothetical protein